MVLLCAVAEPVHLHRRFSYIALNCCSLLDRLEVLNVPKAVDFLVRCKNFDGSFGHVPGECSNLCLHAQLLASSVPSWQRAKMFAGPSLLAWRLQLCCLL